MDQDNNINLISSLLLHLLDILYIIQKLNHNIDEYYRTQHIFNLYLQGIILNKNTIQFINLFTYQSLSNKEDINYYLNNNSHHKLNISHFIKGVQKVDIYKHFIIKKAQMDQDNNIYLKSSLLYPFLGILYIMKKVNHSIDDYYHI